MSNPQIQAESKELEQLLHWKNYIPDRPKITKVHTRCSTSVSLNWSATCGGALSFDSSHSRKMKRDAPPPLTFCVLSHVTAAWL
jgi:hypothetical protein